MLKPVMAVLRPRAVKKGAVSVVPISAAISAKKAWSEASATSAASLWSTVSSPSVEVEGLDGTDDRLGGMGYARYVPSALPSSAPSNSIISSPCRSWAVEVMVSVSAAFSAETFLPGYKIRFHFSVDKNRPNQRINNAVNGQDEPLL